MAKLHHHCFMFTLMMELSSFNPVWLFLSFDKSAICQILLNRILCLERRGVRYGSSYCYAFLHICLRIGLGEDSLRHRKSIILMCAYWVDIQVLRIYLVEERIYSHRQVAPPVWVNQHDLCDSIHIRQLIPKLRPCVLVTFLLCDLIAFISILWIAGERADLILRGT